MASTVTSNIAIRIFRNILSQIEDYTNFHRPEQMIIKHLKIDKKPETPIFSGFSYIIFKKLGIKFIQFNYFIPKSLAWVELYYISL